MSLGADGARRRQLVLALTALSVSPLMGSCTLGPRGPSQVAQGKYYSSGHPTYDGFFLELYELQVRMGQAPIEHTEMGDALAKDLGLATDLPNETLLAALRERTEAARRKGTRLLLVVYSEDGEPVPADDTARSRTATLLTSGDLGSEVTQVKQASEKAANALVQFRQVLAKDLTSLERLGVRVIELEGGVDATFGPEGIAKADEVDENLSDAGKIITLMQARARELLDQSSQELSGLVAATNTDDGRLKASLEKKPEPEPESSDEDEDEEPKEPKKKRPKQRRTPKRQPPPRPAAKPAEPQFEP